MLLTISPPVYQLCICMCWLSFCHINLSMICYYENCSWNTFDNVNSRKVIYKHTPRIVVWITKVSCPASCQTRSRSGSKIPTGTSCSVYPTLHWYLINGTYYFEITCYNTLIIYVINHNTKIQSVSLLK